MKEAATAAEVPDVKIVLTGYCVPTQPECDGKTDMSTLRTAYQEVANINAHVKYVDISEACGGNDGKKGDAQYFTDNIHLNERGYCAAFTKNAVQTELGCESKTVSCEDVSTGTCSAATSLAPSLKIVTIAAIAAVATTLMSSLLWCWRGKLNHTSLHYS